MPTMRAWTARILVLVLLSLICAAAMAPSSKAQGASPWRAEYFGNPNLAGQPILERNETAIDHNWQDGSPDAAIPADGFSARWTGWFPSDCGSYTFGTLTDHGVRLWVDGQLLIGQWGNQVSTQYARQINLTAGYHSLRVEYCHVGDEAMAHLSWERQLGTLLPDYWRAEYFNSPQPAGQAAWVRDEAAINHDWGIDAPAPNMGVDGFSVRWTRDVRFDPEDVYIFTVTADDDVRVWVDGETLIEQLGSPPGSAAVARRRMTQGQHRIIVEYSDRSGLAAIQFSWQGETRPTPTPTPKPPPALRVFDPNVVWRYGGPNESWYERSEGYKGKIHWDEMLTRPSIVIVTASGSHISVAGGTPTHSAIMATVYWAGMPLYGSEVKYDVGPAIATLSTSAGVTDLNGVHSTILTAGNVAGTVWVTATVADISGSVAVQITPAQQR